MSLLRLAVFRSLLLATFVSNVGGWMEDVGETWLMTSLHGTPLMVALVQSSASLPVFLFALPAGTLADIIDRRRMLLATHVWMLLVAALLGVLTITQHIGALGLLACTFAMGIGSALAGPAWQAVIADVVPRHDLPRATMLNGVAFNVGRVAGPALGGLIVARAGPGPTFLLNALSFVAVLVALLRWKRRHRPSVLPSERVWTGMRSGLRYVRDAPTLRALLIRTFTTLFFASALWALLPSFVNRALGGPPSQYSSPNRSLGAQVTAALWRSVFAVAVLHLLDDQGDCGGVDLGFLHQRGGLLHVVGVDRVEEVFNPSDFRELLQHEGALEIALVHHAPPWSRLPSAGRL